ncbi:MAG: thioredoxin domain-containing protein, partial [Candidatus Woesearchaeota archaeon]
MKKTTILIMIIFLLTFATIAFAEEHKILHRTVRDCATNTSIVIPRTHVDTRAGVTLNYDTNEQVLDLKLLLNGGYYNYECDSRYLEQCINDGTFDTWYDEWCEDKDVVAAPKCIDSDNGKNYFVAGTITNNPKYPIMAQDYCSPSSSLCNNPAGCTGDYNIEWYCNADNTYDHTSTLCENGCSNGACLASATTYPINLTLELGETKTYDGVNYTLLGANSDNNNAVLKIGNTQKTVSEGNDYTISGADIYVSELYITSIPTTSATITIIVYNKPVTTTVQTCTDSDGGDNIYVKGIVTLNTIEEQDYCYDDGDTVNSCSGSACQVFEFRCIDEHSGAGTPKKCPNGCNDGACLTSPIDTTTQSVIIGNVNAPITLVEYTEFLCPYCKSFHDNTLPQIVSEYVNAGQVKIIAKQYVVHSGAEKLSVAAYCANEQGKYTEIENQFFLSSNYATIDDAKLQTIVTNLGLNQTKFDACVASKKYDAVVAKDKTDADALGVSGVPTVFINGVQITGALQYSEYKTVIDSFITNTTTSIYPLTVTLNVGEGKKHDGVWYTLMGANDDKSNAVIKIGNVMMTVEEGKTYAISGATVYVSSLYIISIPTTNAEITFVVYNKPVVTPVDSNKLTLELGESKIRNGIEYTLIGANVDTNNAIIKVGSSQKTVSEGNDYTVGGVDFIVDSIYITTIPSTNAMMEITLLSQLTYPLNVSLDLGETKTIDGIDYTLVGANSDNDNAVLKIGSTQKTVSEGNDYYFGGVDIVINELYITSIPTTSASIMFTVPSKPNTSNSNHGISNLNQIESFYSKVGAIVYGYEDTDV